MRNEQHNYQNMGPQTHITSGKILLPTFVWVLTRMCSYYLIVGAAEKRAIIKTIIVNSNTVSA